MCAFYRECIKKTWFPRDFHSNMCLANREIDFHIANGCRFSNLDSRFSTLDWSLFICIGPLPVAPEYCCMQHDRNILAHRWRQLSICLHSVHNWKQFAPPAIADTFCATPIDLLYKHSDWDNETLEPHNICHAIYANYICQRTVRMRSNLLNATLTVFTECDVASFLQFTKQCFAVLS